MSGDDRRMGVGHALLEVLWVALVRAGARARRVDRVVAGRLPERARLAGGRGRPAALPRAAAGWEAVGRAARAAKKQRETTRWLNLWDRLALRTLAINLLFLAALVVRFPAATFAALSTRGDWFLEGRSGEGVDRLRSDLFAAAQRLEWVYRLVRPNPYEKQIDPTQQEQPPPENPVAQDTRAEETPPPPPPEPERPTGPVAVEGDPEPGARRDGRHAGLAAAGDAASAGGGDPGGRRGLDRGLWPATSRRARAIPGCA